RHGREESGAGTRGGLAVAAALRRAAPGPLFREEPVAEDVSQEGDVLFPSRDGLGDGQVVHVETPTRCAPGIGVVYRHQTVTPASGEHGGLLSDTLGVVAVHGMKWRCPPTLPSIRSARSGWFFGKRSASTETLKLARPPGNS